MAQITVTIPDAAINDVIDAFAVTYGWTSDTGLTKAQFAKQKLAEYVKQIYRASKANIAAELARQSALDNADSIIIT